MELERELGDVKRGIKSLDEGIFALRQRRRSISRPGLYLMAFVAMCGSISTCVNTNKVIEGLNTPLGVYVRNVIGSEAPETFYEIGGKRFYFEIDGKPVESNVR